MALNHEPKELELHQYQKDIVKFMEEHPRCYVAAEPGLGKTSCALTRINQLRKKTLVIAPLRICYLVWPHEKNKWTNFHDIPMTILHGPRKEIRFLSDDFGVYVINPEGLKWLDKMIVKHRRFPWKVLIIDEAPRFKSHKTVRFKKIKRMLSRFNYVYLLAGNPIPNSYLDLWSQMFIIDLGKRLYKSFTRFRNRFFYQVDRKGFVWSMFKESPKEIKELVEDVVISVRAKDHIDLPDEVVIDIEFDLPSHVAKQYKSMETKLFSDLDEGKILASNAAVASQKCQQIANGFLYESLSEMDKLKKVEPKAIRLHEIKLDLLEELVEELDGMPILVGYWYKEDLKMLHERFPDTPYIGSGVDMDEAAEIERKWNQKKIPMLFGQIASVSHGLNLQEAGYHVAYYSMVYNFDQFDQFFRRVLRQGNKHQRVIIHRFLARNTVDFAMKRSLDGKGNTAENFLNALKLYRQNKEKSVGK